MLKSLMKIFQKNTKLCDQCGCGINPKKDVALCLHGEQNGMPFEIYVCEPCAEKAWRDTMNDDMLEDVNIAEEDRIDYT